MARKEGSSLARKGGNRRTKRSAAPHFWAIERKSREFTVTTAPGPHGKEGSYPLAVLIRDILKLVKNYREARGAIREGKILVDGVVRRNPDFPTGLMDVVEVPSLNKVFRMVPTKGSILTSIEVPHSEKNLKLCRVRSKTTVRGGKVQYGLHDGRSILSEAEVNLHPDDVCLIEVPSQRIVQTLALKKGAVALAVRGKKAGEIGAVKGVKPGSFTRPKVVELDIGGVVTEVPVGIIMPVGLDRPVITITSGS